MGHHTRHRLRRIHICIDETGTAHVFGEYPEYEDTAYFIVPGVNWLTLPEVCASNNASNGTMAEKL